MMKLHDQEQLGEERVNFTHSSSSKVVRAGTHAGQDPGDRN